MSVTTLQRTVYRRFSPIEALKISLDRFACDLWCWALPFVLYCGLAVLIGARLQFGNKYLFATVVSVLMGIWHGIVADASVRAWRGEKAAYFYPRHLRPALAAAVMWTASSLMSILSPLLGLVIPLFFAVGVSAVAVDGRCSSFFTEPVRMIRAVPLRMVMLVLLAGSLAIIGVFALFIGSAITYPLAVMLLTAGLFLSRGEEDAGD